MQVIVVGAGIGGLSLALSLHQAGVPVRVYEAVRDLAPLGVGINLQPTAVRELTEMGLADELQRAGNATERLSYFNKHGQLVWSEPRGQAAGYNWPQYSIHRGHLQSLLLHAASQRIRAANIRTGLRLTSFEQRNQKVMASFADGTSTVVTDEADILVAPMVSTQGFGSSSTQMRGLRALPSNYCGARLSMPSLFSTAIP